MWNLDKTLFDLLDEVFQSITKVDGSRKSKVEQVWSEILSDLSEWRDHRSRKLNLWLCDFKRKTHQALWLASKWIPPSVEARLFTIAPGTLDFSFSFGIQELGFPNKVWAVLEGGKESEVVRPSKLILPEEGNLAAKGGWSLEPTCSSKGGSCRGGKKEKIEQLWRELFWDPTEWRDHRLHKVNPRFPDFKHKKQTHKALWVKRGWIPPWVKEKLSALPPGTIQLSAFSWNRRLSRFAQAGQYGKTMELFQQMQRDGQTADRFTFFTVLKACASLKLLEYGRLVHTMMEPSLEADLFIGTSLVDMYAKCGSIEEAERVFNQIPSRHVVAWNAMILGYVKCGEGQKAVELFEEMLRQGLDPDSLTFVGVLNACASIAELEGGRRIHEEIIHRNYNLDVLVGTCLMDMYAKCGSVEDAETVFYQMPTRDVVAWTAMLAAYGSHGYVRKALETFERMCIIAEVDGVTFVSLLSACSHGGLMDEGLEYFKSMTSVYNISPTVEHYACVVDILGRAGRLGEAEDLIMSMPLPLYPNATVWMSLLGACRAHVNVEVGERCVKRLLDLEPQNASGYVVLSDIYVAAGKWESNVRVHQERLDRGCKKIPEQTWIEVNKKMHSLVVDDNIHPQIEDIHAELERLLRQMKDAGFAPDPRFKLLCAWEEKGEFQLCHHSEKLAIVLGLISTNPGTPICIVKNLGVCGNCHMHTKFITKTVKRTVVVRDANCIHRFEDGFCSCGDYW